jgi:hypothetical protein
VRFNTRNTEPGNTTIFDLAVSYAQSPADYHERTVDNARTAQFDFIRIERVQE